VRFIASALDSDVSVLFQAGGGPIKIGTVNIGEDIHFTTNDLADTIAIFTGVASAVNYLTVSNSATGDPVLLSTTGSDTDIGLTLRSEGADGFRFEVPGADGLDDFNVVTRFVTNAAGTPVAGFGARFRFTLDNSLNDEVDASWFGSYWVDPTSGSEVSAFRINPLTDYGAGLEVHGVPSAVNYLTVTNAATTEAPTFTATGTDTDIGLTFLVKGGDDNAPIQFNSSDPLAEMVVSFLDEALVFEVQPDRARITAATDANIEFKATGTGDISFITEAADPSWTIDTSAGGDLVAASGVNLVTTDEAYGVGWNGNNEVPTKNALYDKIQTISAGSLPTYALAPVHALCGGM
jgi:hypothetical protein